MKELKTELDNVKMTVKYINKNLELFLTAQSEKRKDVTPLLQKMYKLGFSSNVDSIVSTEILPELVVDDMDEEQIWQQIELRNKHVLQKFIESTAKCIAMNLNKLEIRLNEEYNGVKIESEQEFDEKAYEEDNVHDCDNEHKSQGIFFEDEKMDKNKKKSIVNDTIFQLYEMEQFLEAEEAKEMRKKHSKMPTTDDDEIDYFNDNGEDEDDFDDHYEYDNVNEEDGVGLNSLGKENKTVNTKHTHTDLDGSIKKYTGTKNNDDHESSSLVANYYYPNDDAKTTNLSRNSMQPTGNIDLESHSYLTEDEKLKSSFQQRQQRLEQRIEKYETEVIGEKPWQMKGEVQAEKRPKNSLLEEILEFDSTIRPPPIITEETTHCLEDIIRQRIKNRAWDNVIRVVKPIQTPQDYQKKLVLNNEKSKESLPQIYEKQFKSELDKLKPQTADEEDAPMPKEHQEIRNMMHALFVKLDALSNFHFTVKPVTPEAKIITNRPALNMEEVAPVALSDVKLVAPEEVYRRYKHELLGKSERTRTDKNRELRKKKQKKHAIHKACDNKIERLQKLGSQCGKKLENAKFLKHVSRHRSVEKVTASSDHSALKSSKAFFTKLQDSNRQLSTGKIKSNKKKTDPKDISAIKYKL